MNALVTAIDVPADKDNGKYKIHYSRYSEGSKKGIKEDDEFDLIIGSDGANSRVAKVKNMRRMSAGISSVAPAFRICVPTICITNHFPMFTATLVIRDNYWCLRQAMDAGEYNFAIAFQERIKISDEKMEFYEVRPDELHSEHKLGACCTSVGCIGNPVDRRPRKNLYAKTYLKD